MEKLSSALSIAVGLTVLFLATGYYFYEGYLEVFGFPWLVDRLSRITLIRTGFGVILTFLQLTFGCYTGFLVIAWIARKLGLKHLGKVKYIATICLCLLVILPTILDLPPLFNSRVYSDLYVTIYGATFVSATIAGALILTATTKSELGKLRIRFSKLQVTRKLYLFVFMFLSLCFGFQHAVKLYGIKEGASRISSPSFPTLTYWLNEETTSSVPFLIAGETSSYGINVTVGPNSHDLKQNDDYVTATLTEVPHDRKISITTAMKYAHDYVTDAQSRMRKVVYK